MFATTLADFQRYRTPGSMSGPYASIGTTPRASSLLQAHAPVPQPPPAWFLMTLSGRSSPLGQPWHLLSFDVPAFSECYTLYAGRLQDAFIHFFSRSIGLRPLNQGSAPLPQSRNTTFPGDTFRRGRYSFMLWPSDLLALLIVPTHLLACVKDFYPSLLHDLLPTRELGIAAWSNWTITRTGLPPASKNMLLTAH